MDGEQRCKLVGAIDERLFTVVFVMRGSVRRIISARRADADPPLTAEELEAVRIKRSVQEIRKGRGLSQAEFAKVYRIAAGTLRDWEQGRRRPDTAALAYLATIRHEPAAVSRALKKASP